MARTYVVNDLTPAERCVMLLSVLVSIAIILAAFLFIGRTIWMESRPDPYEGQSHALDYEMYEIETHFGSR